MSWLLKDIILQYVVGIIICLVIALIWKVTTGRTVKWK
jgi:hypothetical protein